MVNTFVSALMGISFAVLGTVTVFLMFHLWGYPFDKVTRKSEAPRTLMILHRVMGFAFLALYIFMMVQMVPRLMRYQVEFPARTVAHIVLAITVGFLLVVKISIIRFFRHLEEWMPVLGTSLLLCTWLLVALSVPFAFRERQLRAKALGGDVSSVQNLERLRLVLPTCGLPKEAPLNDIATVKGLAAGREVLLTKCVQCHDLKTILSRPRAPRDWVQTVDRMTEKPVLGEAVDEQEQWHVAAYLIAITPDLQQSAKKARAQKNKAKEAKVAAVAAMEGPVVQTYVDINAVKPLFEAKCSECHDLSDADKHVWKGEPDVKETMERMIDNGLEATPLELEQLRQYLVATYVKAGAAGAAGAADTAPSTAPPSSSPPTTATPTTAATTADPKPGAKKAAAATTAAPVATQPVPSGATTTAPAALPAAGDAAATCGKKPLPDCPLQGWMKSNAAGASASEDAVALASAFDRMAHFGPPGYGAWATISADGAAAARSGDIKAARMACTGCHNQYRAKYKTEMRARPLR